MCEKRAPNERAGATAVVLLPLLLCERTLQDTYVPTAAVRRLTAETVERADQKIHKVLMYNINFKGEGLHNPTAGNMVLIFTVNTPP